MTFKSKIDWSEPNGSLKSFLYKMIYHSDFRSDILCIWTFFGAWGGFCVWALRGMTH